MSLSDDLYVPCDECGHAYHPCMLDLHPYARTYEHISAHLGLVCYEMICKDCANEKKWWRSQYGLDAEGNPGL